MKILKLLNSAVSYLPLKAKNNLKFLGQLSFFALLLTIFTLTLTRSVLAASPSPCTYDPTFTDQQIINELNKCAIQKNVYDDKIFNLNQIAGTIDSLNTQIIGFSFLHPETNELTADRGALASMTNMVAGLYSNPPASGISYFAEEIHKFNPIQPVYAQSGIGYNALAPVQGLWTAFRNASYVGFVLAFVIIGFMIMFRSHVSPQAVATVQDSIPRIVIALILVTFSYAIAGLMIDLMFLLLNIIINLLGPNGANVLSSTKANDIVFGHSIIGVITGSWLDITYAVAKAIEELLRSVVSLGSVGNFVVFRLGVGGVGALIVGLAALIIMFRIFVMLLMAYVTIILLTLVAPFFFLIQSLPGNNSATTWFKQMAANISVFPTVAIMILFAGIIGGIPGLGGNPTNSGLGTDAITKFPLLVGGIPTDAIGKIIGLGFLFMTPEAANLIKNALNAKGGPTFGAGAASLGAAAGLATWPVRATYQRYQERKRNENLGAIIRGRERPEPGEGGPQPGAA